MRGSSFVILHSASARASPFEFRKENRELQVPRDWQRLLPPFSPATSSRSTHSTLSSSSRSQILPTTPVDELLDDTKYETQQLFDTLRTNDRGCSPLVDESEAAESQSVSQARPQGTQQGPSNVGWQGALPCTGGGEAAISDTCNRAETDRDLPIILPRRYEFCPVQDMVELIFHMFAELIAANDLDPITGDGLTRFHSRTAPSISVRDYLNRLAVYAALAPPLLLVIVYYVDRLCALHPGFSINSLTVHRFLIAAATIAVKALSDAPYWNCIYARVGGVAVKELNILELELLDLLDWKIVPDSRDLKAFYHCLVERRSEYELECTTKNGKCSKLY